MNPPSPTPPQPNEHWLPVPGWEGLYIVSNYGRVKSLDRTLPVLNQKNRFFAGRIIKPIKTPKGYYHVMLCVNGRNKRFYVHRLVAMAFIPNPENKPEVNHRDGVRTNNNSENLEWCTAFENSLDAHLSRGKIMSFRRGEDHFCSKLSETQVKEIRGSPQITASEFGKRFMVRATTIRNIRSGRKWKHIL